jgi:hypothetical protein
MKQTKNRDPTSTFELELTKLESEARRETYELSRYFEPEQALRDVYQDERKRTEQQNYLNRYGRR